MNDSRCLIIKLALQPPANEFVEVSPLEEAIVEISKVGLFLLEVVAIGDIPEQAIEYQRLRPQLSLFKEYFGLQITCSVTIQCSQAIEFYSIVASLRHEFLSASQLSPLLECGHAPSQGVMLAYQPIFENLFIFQFPQHRVILPISIRLSQQEW